MFKKTLTILKPHGLIIALIVGYLFLSLMTYKEYGVTTDEPLEYESANKLLKFYQSPVNYEGIVKKLNKLPEDKLREEPLASDYYRGHLLLHAFLYSADEYFQIHLLNMLMFVPVVITAYYAFLKVFKKSWLAIIAPLFLLLDPRIFGHIPANPKDIPFAVWYVTTLCLIIILQNKSKSPYRNLLLGVSLGLTIAIRPLGITILLSYAVYLAYQKIVDNNFCLRNGLTNLFYQLCIAFIFIFITWPYIGVNPINNYLAYLVGGSKFSHWTGTVLFEGTTYAHDQIPRYYLYKWLYITTPLVHIILIILGTFKMRRLLKNKLFILFTSSALINFLLYAIFNPLIYNGYRHYLFLVAILTTITAIILAEYLKNGLNNLRTRFIAFLVIVLQASVFYTTIKLHPYQYIYFNEISGGLKRAGTQYESDYWLASRIEAVRWILANTNYGEEVVYGCNMSYILSYYSNERIKVTNEPDLATITICDPKRDGLRGLDGQVLHEVQREGVTLTIVRKKSSITTDPLQ